MKSNLLMDFTADKSTNSVNVTREFDAPLNLVWDAWTKPELLDQWWGPKPYKAVTKSMDFREGGEWFYAMVGPEGDEHFCKNEYHKIELQKFFSGLDAFCHPDGRINSKMPRTLWENTFKEENNITRIHVLGKYESLADLEKIIAMGFKEGFTIGLNQLEELLTSLK